MKSMFENCNELEYLDLSNFKTSKVTNMENMFNQCYEIKEIKGINNFNTNNVTNMRCMFKDCNELKSLNLSNFNTFNVLNMSKMFENCFELESLDISNFNTFNVIDMSFMFTKCYKLKEIKGIENFVFENVIKIDEMFSECYYSLQPIKELLTEINKTILNKKPAEQNKKLITVYFTSGSQEIQNFPLSCYNTDTFSVLIEKLIAEKPDLKHKNLHFLSGGKLLDSSLTLDQNKIKDKDSILLYEDN